MMLPSDTMGLAAMEPQRTGVAPSPLLSLTLISETLPQGLISAQETSLQKWFHSPESKKRNNHYRKIRKGECFESEKPENSFLAIDLTQCWVCDIRPKARNQNEGSNALILDFKSSITTPLYFGWAKFFFLFSKKG